MMNNISSIISVLREDTKDFVIPSVTSMALQKISPYEILISTLLSLRTKDEVTYEVSLDLFKIANTPKEMIKLKDQELQKIIFRTGFYRNKTKTLKNVSKEILERFSGKVPDNMDDLLSLKGVGRKTANLVLIKAFNKAGICVDTHVHRISNRLGLVNTKDADSTEMSLRKDLPKEYWMEINDLLVKYGQNICRPVGPKCDRCNLTEYCKFYKKKKK